MRRYWQIVKWVWRVVFAGYIPEWLGGLGTVAMIATAFTINPHLGGYTLGVSGLIWGLVVAESNRPR